MVAVGYHRVAIGVPLRILALIMLSASLSGGQAFLFDAAAAGAPSSRDPDAAVAAAINRLRGVHLEGMSAADKDALGARLDRAWDVLYDHPEEAEKAIVEVLATEKDDNFLLVDLAHMLTVLDPDHPEPAAAALLKAKVTADPPGTFHAAANMAAAHCAACLPAVLRILEIKNADTLIVEHALPIDPELMLVFTLGQYGDDAIAPVSSKLSSDNCVVRGNAALALGVLQPPTIPEPVRTIAAGDACEDARGRAWAALGLLDDPQLVGAVTKRLAGAPPAPKIERLGIVHGLAAAFSPAAKAPLKKLTKDSDSEVASAARRALLGLDELQKRMDQIKKDRAGISPRKRAKMIRKLEKAVRAGRIDLGIEPDDLLTTLTPSDIPLLNRARAAVLSRLSDECLDEYYPMTHAVRALRGSLASPGVAPRD